MDAEEATTPLQTPAPTYGAVPEAAPVARRPRKALVAALGGAGLLFAAVGGAGCTAAAAVLSGVAVMATPLLLRDPCSRGNS